MNRREAIRNIAIASTATIFITSCSDKNVAEFLVDGTLSLNQKHKDYLSKISETILPVQSVSEKIDSPVDFITTMLNDCTSAEDLSSYVSGFEQYKLLMQENSMKIKNAEPSEVINLITAALESKEPKDDLIHFISKTKDLSIQNLKTSEYFKTEVEDYKMIPDAYQACIDV